MAWIDDYARACGCEMTEEVRTTLLALARDVAHTTERANAPLASYLAGRFVERRIAEGSTEAAALRELAARGRPFPPKA